MKKGFITGSFDLYHAGHSRILKYARLNCDELFVGLNSDKRITEKKGKGRPIYPIEERLQIIYFNQNVTEVRKIEYDGSGSSVNGIRELLRHWQPDVWISGACESSRHNFEILKLEFDIEYLTLNCELVHTTSLIRRIKERKFDGI